MRDGREGWFFVPPSLRENKGLTPFVRPPFEEVTDYSKGVVGDVLFFSLKITDGLKTLSKNKY